MIFTLVIFSKVHIHHAGITVGIYPSRVLSCCPNSSVQQVRRRIPSCLSTLSPKSAGIWGFVYCFYYFGHQYGNVLLKLSLVLRVPFS